jgi:hypothetical protein
LTLTTRGALPAVGVAWMTAVGATLAATTVTVVLFALVAPSLSVTVSVIV